MISSFEAALQKLPKAVAMMRASDGIVVYGNERCLEMFAGSVGSEGFVGQRFMAHETAGGGDDFERVIAEQLERGAPHALYESERRRKNGEVAFIQVTVTQLTDPVDGLLWMAVIEDITPFKQAAVALEEANRDLADALTGSELSFQRIVDSGMFGMFRGKLPPSPEAGVLQANPTFCKMLGWSEAEIHGGALRAPSPLFAPEARERALRSAEELRSRGYSALHETELVRRDGSRVPVLIGAALTAELEFVAIVLDRSDYKAKEEALHATEEQLRQAQKMEAIGRLAGGVAHDFNNILSVILGYAEMIREAHAEHDAVRADADEIHQAASRAANLTKQLLLFTRQQVAETKVLDLSDTLSSMHNMLERLVGEDIRIVTLPGRRLGKVRADPAHLEQVVLNLAVNARDAMPAGGTLTLETCNAEGQAHAGCVLLKVSDTGSGMDAATQPRIFEPFFTTKEKDKGTGLGLSTVFGIVQQANGTISVESELGKGSCFTIALPRVDAELAQLPEGEPERTSKPGHETILLVEDEPEVRRIARKILETSGYRVLEVNSAVEALEVFDRERGIHLVITDVVMPQMNGVELIRRLQERVRPGVALRVLCMSGYTDDETARHGLKEQRVPFLQKPFTPSSLRQKVREVLEGPVARGSGEFSAVRIVAKS